MSQVHHASCVEFEGIGILVRGPAGAGKSDLSLRLIDAGATLVADDRVVLEARDGRLMARAPEGLAGLLEIRGLGIVTYPHCTATAVGFVVDLAGREGVARLPLAADTVIDGVALPAFRLAPFEPSAVAKLRVAAKLAAGRLLPVEAALGHRLAQRSA